MNMHVYCSLLVTASWIAALVCQNCRIIIYYKKVCPIPYGDILIELATHSVTACAVMCASNVSCRSFLYEPHTAVCKTNSRYTQWPSMDYVRFPGFCTDMAYYGVVLKGNCLDVWLDGPCATSSDCAAKNSTACIENRCVCDVGYSRFPRVDACVPECSEYGRGFKPEQYQLADTDYLKSIEVRLPFKMDLFLCRLGCMQAIPTCRFIQYKPETSECYTSEETALTKPDAVWPAGSNWTTYLRNCY